MVWGKASKHQTWPLFWKNREAFLRDLGKDQEGNGLLTATAVDGAMPGAIRGAVDIALVFQTPFEEVFESPFASPDGWFLGVPNTDTHQVWLEDFGRLGLELSITWHLQFCLSRSLGELAEGGLGLRNLAALKMIRS